MPATHGVHRNTAADSPVGVDGRVGRGLLLQGTWRASQSALGGRGTFRNGLDQTKAADSDFDLKTSVRLCIY